MGSNSGSIQTNIYEITFEAFGDYGVLPSCVEFLSRPASAEASSLHGTNERVASPRTQARQEEMARLIVSERQRYLDNANASETGSAMDRHMMNYMHSLENATTAPQPPNATNTVDNDQGSTYVDHVDNCQGNTSTSPVDDGLASTAYRYIDNSQGSFVRDVNFRGVYGRITRVEHIPYLTNDISPIITSVAPDSCAPPLYAPAHASAYGSANGHIYTAQGDYNVSQTSSISQLRRRTACGDLAHEAGFKNDDANVSKAAPVLRNVQHVTVESAQPSPSTLAHAPTPAQNPLHMINGNHLYVNNGLAFNASDQEPPQYADVGQNTLDQPLPPHLDPNDPVGADFLTGMQELRRAGDRVQTFGTSLGIQQHDPAIQEINQTHVRAATHFTTGFLRAAAAAANERERHQQTNDLLNRLRLTSRGLQGHFMAQTARAEAAEARLALVLRQEEYLRADLAAARALAGGAAARAAALEMALVERRGENERLLGEAAEMERTLYGYD